VTPRKLILTITSPQGTSLDVSGLLDIGQVGSVSTTPETDLGILSHGEMAITLDNSTGEIEAFLEGAAPSDIYQVRLVRERQDGSGWDRMFGGVLDLPYSLSYDDVDKTANVVAYSYSKQLERTPADGTAGATSYLKRTLAPKTAKISLDSSTLQFISGETADLEIGDVVRLSTGQAVAEFTIARIVNATDAITTKPSEASFPDTYTEVMTPFFHDRSPSFILGRIARESGVTMNDLNLGNTLATFPTSTPISRANLAIGVTPYSLYPDTVGLTQSIVATFGVSTGITTRKTLSSPDAAWLDGDVDSQVPIDWTPYLATKPATVLVTDPAIDPADAGTVAADHSAQFRYYIKTLVAGGPRYLFRNLVNLGQIVAEPEAPTLEEVRSLDFDPATNRVFICIYRKSNPSVQKFKYWNGASFVDIATSGVGGNLRCIRYYGGTRIVRVDVYTNDLHVYNGLLPNGAIADKVLPWIGLTTDYVQFWTMRTWGPPEDGLTQAQSGCRYLSVLFERYGATWVAIYDARGLLSRWVPLAQYKVSERPPLNRGAGVVNACKKHAYQTVLTMPSGEQFACGYSGDEWFVLATYHAGIIRYADFKESSCAKAARDVAIAINAVVDFDAFGVMSIRNRNGLALADPVMDLGTPLTCTRYPVSEVYRSSVTVEGVDSVGDTVSETQGATGDSARRLTLSSDLIANAGMALATAITTLQFVSQIREQRDVTVIDDGTPLAVFDRVTMAGKTWLIYKLETDLEQQIHTMTLLELKP